MNGLDAKHKVFGLGLSRTGTSSLGEALNQLGIKTIHFPYDATTQRELSSNARRLTILERYQGIVDISIVPFYKQLDAGYPNSKFILTLRQLDSWLNSVKRSLEKTALNWDAYEPQYREFFRFINSRVYGSWTFDQARFSDAYNRHAEDVVGYFQGRPGDLLVLNVAEGDNWGKLCSFLGLPQPQTSFPYKNDASVHLDWIDKLGAVKGDLDSVIRCGTRFVLVDHSALDVVDLGQHKNAQTSLLEWGHPADDLAAIEALECKRGEGVEYLVFAWPAFWWFDYYRRFIRYTEERYPCVLQNERLVVYALRPGQSESRAG